MPLLTLAATLAYVPGIPSAASVGRWIVVGVGAALLLLLVRIRPTPAHWMGLGLIAWVLASLVWSASPEDTLGALLILSMLAVVFVVAAEHGSIEECLVMLAVGVSISVPFAGAQLLGYSPVETTGGASGLFLTTTALAEPATIALIAMIALRRWLLAAGPAACVLMAGSVASAAVLLLAAVVWLWRHDLRTSAVLAVLTVMLVVVAATPAHLEPRLDVWSVALANISPLGWGLGTFGTLLPVYETAHSEPLTYAVELGLGALSLAGVLGYALLWRGPGLERTLLAVILVQSLVAATIHAPTTALLLAALAGSLAGARGRARIEMDTVGGRGAPRVRHARPDRPGAAEWARARSGALAAGPRYPRVAIAICEDLQHYREVT